MCARSNLRHQICQAKGRTDATFFESNSSCSGGERIKIKRVQAITYLGLVLVVLETSDAVQPLQVNPAFPPHAHSIHYEVRSQVNLRKQEDEWQLEEIGLIIAHGNNFNASNFPNMRGENFQANSAKFVNYFRKNILYRYPVIFYSLAHWAHSSAPLWNLKN